MTEYGLFTNPSILETETHRLLPFEFRFGLFHLTHVHSIHFSKIRRMPLADIKNDFPLDP